MRLDRTAPARPPSLRPTAWAGITRGDNTELRDLRDEHAVRQVVNALNTEIAAWLCTPEGPRVVVRPVNTDDAVHQGRAHRGRTDPPATPPAPADDPAPRSRRRRRA